MDDHAAIARDIAAARARIAGTAEALLYRADVKARVGDEVAGRLADARERFAGLAAAFGGNGRTSNGAVVDGVGNGRVTDDGAYVTVRSMEFEPFDEAALDEGMIGEVSLAQIPSDDVPPSNAHVIPGNEHPSRSRNFMPAIVAAFATALVVWLLLAKRRRDELQDRDPA
jgi:hypothetical protein